MDFAPSTMLPLNLADRPGMPGGMTPPTHLSPSDLSGIVSHKPKPRDAKAVFAPHETGIAGIDGKSLPADAAATQHARLEAQAGQLVSQTFFGTMLKQMRDSPFKSDLFDGGKGGQAFNQLYDQRLVEQMSRGAGKKLVNSIVRKFEAKQAYGKQGKPAAQMASSIPTANASSMSEAAMSGSAANRPAALSDVSAADNHSNPTSRSHVQTARRA
jgi:Rod binding domain-containing protein